LRLKIMVIGMNTRQAGRSPGTGKLPKDNRAEAELLIEEDLPEVALIFGNNFGLVPQQKIRVMARRSMIKAERDALQEIQFQPASLDLRLGRHAYRVRASFLPGKSKLPGKRRTVSEQLQQLKWHEFSLEGDGAVLEKGCVYVVPLLEYLDLPKSISGVANPKSSTGRLDIFTRLIADDCEIFDHVPDGYKGPLYAEISPRSFSVRVRTGSRLNQIRFRRRNSKQQSHMDFAGVSDRELLEQHERIRLVDDEPFIRNGLNLSVSLKESLLGDTIGYRAQKHTDIIDVDRVNAYDMADYWDPIRPRADSRLILDPDEFYILASREKLHIPPDLAAEMVPIDPAMGEFRVHYAGFFDPGFGYTEHGHPGSRAVLEVRSHGLPFIIEDGQVIGRLEFERMAERPDILYGQTELSNYQGQGLKLSKHFKAP
jgi:dCTP deaminase